MGSVTPGYLGPVHGPYVPDGQGRGNLTLGKINADRMKSRTELLHELDTLRRDADQTGKMGAMDEFTQRAVDVVTSGKMGDALDLQKEKPETLKRYVGTGNNYMNGTSSWPAAWSRRGSAASR